MFQLRRSSELLGQARSLMPGGVSSPGRAFTAVGGTPPFIARGEGAYLWDVDGNRYVDFLLGWGPLIAGHAHPTVVPAVQEAAARGTTFGAPVEGEVKLAQRVLRALPAVEMVRFVNSGTEATLAALRLARAATGRNGIIKLIGCYHGGVDSLLVHAGASPTSGAAATHLGVPEGLARHTLVAPYNNLAAAAELFRGLPTDIAAVIVEPVAGNMGVVPPAPGFLAGLRDLTQRYGALLIFDEVMTGFRVGPGSAQGLYQVRPDLTCLGKIIGGGLPIGAIGGSRKLMELLSPAGPVYQASTFAGNPVTMAAGDATLALLEEPGVYPRLEALAQRLAQGLLQAAQAAGIPATVNRVGSMLTLFFTDGPVSNYDDARRADSARYARYFHAMLRAGVYLPCLQTESLFLSIAHTEADIDLALNCAEAALVR